MATMSLPTTSSVRSSMPNPQLQSEAPFRLNRRGRQVRAIFLLIALVSVLFIASQKVAHASSETVIVSVTVNPGETLWDIATQVNPAQDPRDTIEEIKALNELSSSDIDAGTSLMVPRY